VISGGSLSQHKRDRLFDRLSVALFLIVLGVITLTYEDYGVTWDEAYHLAYGDHIFWWYASGFQNKTALTFRIDYLYGGGFDVLGSLFRRLLRGMDIYRAIHLFGAYIGLLGIVGTWKLGRLLGGSRAGFLCALLLTLTPVYYGHMFNNPKDLPFAVGYVWGLYYICGLILAFPRIPRKLALCAAFTLGLACSVRIGGLLLICYFGLAIVLWCIHRGWIQRSGEVGYRYFRHLTLRATAIVAGAWFVMLLSWPWAQLDPLKRPLAALTRMSEFIDHRREMPFAGRWISNLDVPRDYLLHYFGLKLPELVILLFLGALVAGGLHLAKHLRRRDGFPQALVLAILGLSILFPPAYAIYKKSVLYDGLRHFLFIVPPIVVAAGLLLEHIGRRLSTLHPSAGTAAFGALVLVHSADQVATSVRYHPHQYVYFNRVIGGLQGAEESYSTDYYGETYKEALEGMADKLWNEDPDAYLQTVHLIEGCIGEGRISYYLKGGFRSRPSSKTPLDFWVGYTRQKCHLRHEEFPVYFEVRREGALLNRVRDLRGASETSADTEAAPVQPARPKRTSRKAGRRPRKTNE
jgi:hypothetical protein